MSVLLKPVGFHSVLSSLALKNPNFETCICFFFFPRKARKIFIRCYPSLLTSKWGKCFSRGFKWHSWVLVSYGYWDSVTNPQWLGTTAVYCLSSGGRSLNWVPGAEIRCCWTPYFWRLRGIESVPCFFQSLPTFLGLRTHHSCPCIRGHIASFSSVSHFSLPPSKGTCDYI